MTEDLLDIPLDIMSSHHVADSSEKESAETPLLVPTGPNNRLYRFMIEDELKERSAVLAFCDVWTDGHHKAGSPRNKIEVRRRYWLAVGAARVCDFTPALLPDRSALR